MSKSQWLQIKHIIKFLAYLVSSEICPLELSTVNFSQLFHIHKRKERTAKLFFFPHCDLLIGIAETTYKKKKQNNPKPNQPNKKTPTFF